MWEFLVYLEVIQHIKLHFIRDTFKESHSFHLFTTNLFLTHPSSVSFCTDNVHGFLFLFFDLG